MEIRDFNKLPDDDDIAIVGTREKQQPPGMEAEKHCEECQHVMYVSLKNANRKHYICLPCAFTAMKSHDAPEILSTDRDIDEALDTLPGMDKEALIRITDHYIQKLRKEK